MADPNDIKLKVDEASSEEFAKLPSLIELSEARRTELTSWLRAYIPELIRARNDDIEARTNKWRKTLRGESSKPPFRTGASNLSTPLTIWAAAAIRARIRQAVVEQKPVIAAIPLKAKSSEGIDLNRIAAAYAKVFQAEFESPRGLGGAQAVEKGGDEATNVGTAGFKVYEEVKLPRYATGLDGIPALQPAQTRVRWDFIRLNDLIYVDGYGDDTQAMPVVGHQYKMTWLDMKAWEAAKHFYPDALAKVAHYYSTGQSDQPSKLREHDLAELYMDYCIEDAGAKGYTGFPTAALITWHIDSSTILRCAYNPTPLGIRPLFIAKFDNDPDSTKARGQGVCEKLEGAQDETDMIHNLGIEAAKRATAHLIGLKAGTGAEAEFGGEEPVNPGDTYTTENPTEDVVLTALGDPKGVEIALVQENNTRQYVSRLLGLDESAIGTVETGKRVPASLGLSIQREGRVIAANAIRSFANVLRDMAYLTGDLWKRRPPIETLAAVLDPAEAVDFNNVVFVPTDTSTRQQFVLTISAQDAATTMEQRKMELMSVNQMLMGYYQTLIQYAQMAMQLPPPLQAAVLLIAQKMENGVKALLNTVDSVNNPSEVLPAVAELAELLQQAQQAMQATQGPPGMGGPPMGGAA